jgi:hypothetical protein
MNKYRTKAIEVEARQWFKHGDHEAVKNFPGDKSTRCGWISTPEGRQFVCPGNWIIKDANGYSICNPENFHETYEKVDEGK